MVAHIYALIHRQHTTTVSQLSPQPTGVTPTTRRFVPCRPAQQHAWTPAGTHNYIDAPLPEQLPSIPPVAMYLADTHGTYQLLAFDFDSSQTPAVGLPDSVADAIAFTSALRSLGIPPPRGRIRQPVGGSPRVDPTHRSSRRSNRPIPCSAGQARAPELGPLPSDQPAHRLRPDPRGRPPLRHLLHTGPERP